MASTTSTSSTYYRAAARDTAREDKQFKLDEARRKKASAAIMAVVSMSGEVAKTKKAETELTEFASDMGWGFDKETSMYFKTGVNDQNNPYVASISMSQMAAYKKAGPSVHGEGGSGIDDFIFDDSTGMPYSQFSDMHDMKSLERLYAVDSSQFNEFNSSGELITDRSKMKGFAKHIDPKTGKFDTSAITTDYHYGIKGTPYVDEKTGMHEPGTYWGVEFDESGKSTVLGDHAKQFGEYTVDKKTGARDYTTEDSYLTTVGGEKAWVTASELYELESGLFGSRSEVEQRLIDTSKEHAQKHGRKGAWDDKTNPVYFDVKTGIRRFQTGQTGFGTAGQILSGVGSAAMMAGMAIPGIGWAAAALMAVDWIAGANKAAKKYKKEAKMLGGAGSGARGGRMGQQIGETYDKAGVQTQKDLKALRGDYAQKVKHMSSEFGTAAGDLSQQIGAAQKKTRGLYSGSVETMKETAMKRLQDSFSKGEEGLEFAFGNAYDKYTRDLSNQMASRQTELEDMYDQWKYARDHSSTWDNLF
tara:strand:- start:17868 stop:19457 length:1590 start_codon:yes stop_codon:yes gene_type:complete